MSDLETPVGPMSPVTESANTDTPKTPNAPEPQEEALPIIECLCTAECTSVSGRSTLTYAIGRHPDQSLHLRIVSNSGGGMFCGDWAAGDRIDALVAGGQELTSRSFHALHPGKSINTGGFVMSALRDLGLIRLNPDIAANPGRADDVLYRLRAIVNVLTRIRYCTADGTLDLNTKIATDDAPEGFMPWFDVPGRRTAQDTLVFGHWSTLGWLARQDVFSIDSGCVWGGQLTALRLGASAAQHTPIRVPCPQAQAPGAD